MMTKIPYGFCACGCGQKTTLAPQTDNKRGWIKDQPRKFIIGHNHWRGGRIIHKSGYVMVKVPKHPRANSLGYVMEHILVLEKAFRRPILPHEAAHHRDGDRTNNAVGNLILFAMNAMHTRHHASLRAFESCGHYDWRPCSVCSQYDSLDNLQKNGPRGHIHRECRQVYNREYKAKRAISG